MTLSFIPKLLAMFVVMIVAGPWMLGVLMEYMQRLYANISLDGGIIHVTPITISITTAELNDAAGRFPVASHPGSRPGRPAPVLQPQRSAAVRFGLAIMITLIVAPTLGSMPPVEPVSQTGLLILAQQIAIGLAIGFVMRIVFVAVEMAGELIGLQMGLGFATFFDPESAGHIPVVGQFLGLVVTLFFLTLNGHLQMISLLSQSFSALPIGGAAWRQRGSGPWCRGVTKLPRAAAGAAVAGRFADRQPRPGI